MRRCLAVLGVLLLAAGCAADDSRISPETGDGAAAVEFGVQDDTRPAPAGPDTEPADEPERPDQPAEPEDAGVTTVVVDDAGEVDVRIDDADRLELVDVRPADGWRYTVDEAGGEEIELEFDHRSGRAIDVEISSEAGELTTEID